MYFFKINLSILKLIHQLKLSMVNVSKILFIRLKVVIFIKIINLLHENLYYKLISSKKYLPTNFSIFDT